MSYLFDGANDSLAGTMTGSYAGNTVTMAVKMKVTAHPLASDYLLTFGNIVDSLSDSHRISSNNDDDKWTCRTITAAAATSDVDIPSLNVDGTWASFVYRISSASLRDFFINSLSNTAQVTVTRSVSNALKYVLAGTSATGVQDFTGRLAEIAIWRIALADADITSYMNGTPASSIQAANLIGYWPLNANNATQSNLGIDAGGDLTVTGAVYDSDHPTITQAFQYQSRLNPLLRM